MLLKTLRYVFVQFANRTSTPPPALALLPLTVELSMMSVAQPPPKYAPPPPPAATLSTRAEWAISTTAPTPSEKMPPP